MKTLFRKQKTLFRKHLFGIAVILMLTGVITMTALAETYTATTMRLLHYEGTVEILDASGQPRAAVENARFDSGESLQTGAASNASVGMDANKIVTLDENTRVQFTKQSNLIQISVADGSILLDVKEKLQQNETLDIQTSTMAVGIRGTVVIASDMELEAFRSKMNERTAATDRGQDDGQSLSELEEALQNIPSGTSGGRVSTLGILEGMVEIKYLDESGSAQTISVNAGQKATLLDINEDGKADQKPFKEGLSPDDIFRAAADTIDSDPTLKARVEEAGTTVPGNSSNVPGDQNDPSGSWTIDTPVTVVAQSASKMFDGDPLTRTSDVLIYGLPQGYHAQASAGGSQTDAGKGDNPVSSFAIYDGVGNNVTSHFTNISKIPGQLIVDPAPLTVTIGSATKVYDGTPLTCADTQLSFSPGYDKRTVSQRNLSYVITEKAAATASDSQTLYGICGTVLVHGSNPITGEVKEFSLKAGERLTVYLSDKIEENGTSIEYKVEPMTVADIPVEILRLYMDNPDLMSQACTDTGWLLEDLQKRIEELKLQESEKKSRDENGLYVDSINPENLMKDCTNVRITIDTDITDYSDRALGKEEAHYTPMKVDASIKVITSGSITDVGSAANTYTIDWGSANKENYKLIEQPGTLTVTPAPATVTTGSAKKEYDGTPLTDNEASISGLVNGETATVTATGSITDVGSTDNTCDIDWGTAKKGNYDVEKKLGTLKVTGNSTPVAIRISFAGKTYDGTPLVIDHVTVEGRSFDTVRTAAAQSDSTGTVTVEGLPEGYIFTAEVSGSRTDAGTSELSIDSYRILDPDGNDASDNFSKVEITGCTVTIDPAPATVTTGSASKAYDGSPLTCDEASITGLTEADTASVTVTATGSITDVGTTENTYTIDWGSAKSSNYTLTETKGTLEVTLNPAEITFKASSDSKTYDGTPLQAETVTVTGLPEGFSFTASASGSQTDAGSSENTVASHKILNADENDVTASFSNIKTEKGTLTVNPAAATVATGSASKEYDDKPLTSAEASISGLADTDKDAVTVTATGTITDVGSTENTYTIDWGTAKSGNYTLSETKGTLEVTQNTTEITFKAPSASKTYDGTPLKAETVTVTGLPDGFTFTASAAGSQTDAGSSDNTVASYKILNADETDVTASFSNIKTENGTLTVSPAAATVTTGSASKEYDGKPLTSTEASISGLLGDDNGAVTVTATGTITDVGTAENTYTIDWGTVKSDNYTLTKELGTLEITQNSTEITFKAPSVSKTYDGTPLQAGTVTVTGLPEGLTFTASASGSQTDAGSSESTVAASYKILDANEKDVTANFSNIKTEKGTLTVNPAPATVTTGSATQAYNGTALTKAEASISGLADADKDAVTVTATGTITDVGTTENTYTIDWGTAKSSNYTLSENKGTLKVTKNNTAFTIAADSASKAYDGKPLTKKSVTTSGGFPTGLRVYVKIESSQTNVGSSANEISSLRILDKSDKDVTEYFTNIGTADGTLTVTKNNTAITFTTASTEETYTGYAITAPDVTVEGLPEGLHYVSSAGGMEAYVDAGTYSNAFTDMEYEVETEDGPAYGWRCAAIYDADDNDVTDYFTNIILKKGTVKINPAAATVTTGSADKTYDGTPLTCSEASITGLADSDKDSVTVTAAGTITDVGSKPNSYIIDWGTRNSGNYIINESLGTLEVTQLNVTFDLACFTAVYEGYPFFPDSIKGKYDDDSDVTCESLEFTMDSSEEPTGVVGIFDLIGGAKVTMKCGVYREVGTYTVIPDCEFSSGNEGNYNFKYKENVMKIEPVKLIVDLDNPVAEYDGELHGLSIEILSVEYGNEELEGLAPEISYITTNYNGGYKVVFDLFAGDQFKLACQGKGPAAGTYTLDCSCSFDPDNTGNYEVEVKNNTLTISEPAVIVEPPEGGAVTEVPSDGAVPDNASENNSGNTGANAPSDTPGDATGSDKSEDDSNPSGKPEAADETDDPSDSSDSSDSGKSAEPEQKDDTSDPSESGNTAEAEQKDDTSDSSDSGNITEAEQKDDKSESSDSGKTAETEQKDDKSDSSDSGKSAEPEQKDGKSDSSDSGKSAEPEQKDGKSDSSDSGKTAETDLKDDKSDSSDSGKSAEPDQKNKTTESSGKSESSESEEKKQSVSEPAQLPAKKASEKDSEDDSE